MPENVLNRVADAFAGSAGAGHWGCLPGRPAGQKRCVPSLPDLQYAPKGAGKLGAEDLLELEFATLAMNRGSEVDREPSEMVISMRPGKVSREGVNAIVGLMNKVLDLPDVYGGFAVVFDFRSMPRAALQLEAALHIMRWDRETGWQSRCMCQCAYCVVLVQACALEEARQQLMAWYSFRPPPYSTYLATEPASSPGSGDESATRFSPPESWPAPARAPKPVPAQVPPSPGSSAPSTPLPLPALGAGGGAARSAVRGAAQKLAASPPVSERSACGGCPADKPKSTAVAPPPTPVPVPGTAPAARAAARGEKEAAVEPAVEELPPSVDAGFIYVTHFTRKDGMEELLVETRDREQTDEGLDRALKYMDRFSKHSMVDKGFCVTYDLRGLHIPSISMVMKIAAWGNHPDRVQRFQKLNTACKVCFTAGIAYTIGKGLLTIFFSQCPPVVRTYVLTDPNEPEETAVHFDPSPKREAPAARAEAAARWAREARLPGQETLPPCSAGNGVALLDVGFASLELSFASARSPFEFRLRSGSGAPGREGVAALLELLCNTLSLRQVSGDFSVCFDLRSAKRPLESLELVLRARRWRGALDWPMVCAQRCVGWRIAVQAGEPFKEVHATLDCFFHLHQPVCPTRLVTSLDDNGGHGAKASAKWPHENGHSGGDCAACSLLVNGDEGLSLDTPLEALAVPPWRGAGLPCSLDAGFLQLSHGPGQLLVRSRKGRPQTKEGLGMVLAFLDDFTQCYHPEGGFDAHFDLRELRLPSLVTICHLAIWGAEPARRARWRHLCVSCAVVVGPGLVFLLAKGLLSKFFSICPPVCRTLLLRDPDEPHGSAFSFEPAPLGREVSPRLANGRGPNFANGGASATAEPLCLFGLGGERLHPDDDPWVF